VQYKDKAKIKKEIEEWIPKFNAAIQKARENGCRYWFIFEKPFHKCVSSTFLKGHAIVTNLPTNFRIRLVLQNALSCKPFHFRSLPAILKECDFRESMLAHLILNMTFNYLTKFDPIGVDTKEEFNKTLSNVCETLRSNNFLSLAVLSVPVVSLAVDFFPTFHI
jgi:hypothetical protein